MNYNDEEMSINFGDEKSVVYFPCKTSNKLKVCSSLQSYSLENFTKKRKVNALILFIIYFSILVNFSPERNIIGDKIW